MNKRERERQEQLDDFNKQCAENVAKGLTPFGLTKTFDGESIDLYINNKKMVCTVDYQISSPHMEFRGEPCLLTETGYRSHFMNGDLNRYKTLKEAVEVQVGYIIRENKEKKDPYSLTWEPSLDYLAHSPDQLVLL